MFDESTVDINVLPTTFAPVLEAERSNEACSAIYYLMTTNEGFKVAGKLAYLTIQAVHD